MQNKKNLRRLVQWLAIAAAAVWLIPGGIRAAGGQRPTAAAQAHATSTTVLSLKGNGWVVAADLLSELNRNPMEN